MHSCPDCGQACYCHGDIDDCPVEDEIYSAIHCTHYLSFDCDGDEADDFEEMDEEEIYDDRA